MSVNNPLRFAFDFFFTDIMNHCEFLKWTMRLEKNDDILLIAILERLACGPADRKGGKRQLHTPVFYQDFFNNETGQDHQDLTKHPIRVARARRHLMDLRGHSYNIFEVAYLNQENTLNKVYAWSSVIFQVCVVVVLFWWHLSRYVAGEEDFIRPYIDKELDDGQDGTAVVRTTNESFVPVLMVLIISTTFFSKTFHRSRKSVDDFNGTFDVVGQDEGALFQLFNAIVNKLLVGCVLLSNIYFLLLSETPTDAILNSAALGFIIEIDNLLAPDWKEDRVEDELAVNTHDFIMEPEEVGIQVFRTTDEETVVPKWKCFPYSNSDKWYIHVYAQKALIVVHRSKHDDNNDVEGTLAYEKITYTCSGEEAKIDEFFEAICSFNCVESLGDFHD
jgi:hypothetical protein